MVSHKCIEPAGKAFARADNRNYKMAFRFLLSGSFHREGRDFHFIWAEKETRPRNGSEVPRKRTNLSKG